MPNDRHDSLCLALGRERKVQAPLSVMRFDESMYRALGENLIDLTNEQEIMLDPGTYFERSSSSSKVPGALIKDMNFAL